MNHAILLISCPDRKGITAAVTNFVFRHGGNIVDADQHTDIDASVFFMRIKWELAGFGLAREHIENAFRPVAEEFAMSWELYFDDRLPRVAVFVSRHLHCLHDLLFRYRSGQLPCSLALVLSNHQEAEPMARQWGVEFLHVPVMTETKADAEAQQLAALQSRGIDCIVLARYHQILSAGFIERYRNRIINIHHSFLPAFAGASPYAQAHRKGVKIIGATSHYVVEALDEGPIIEQDTARVSHKHSLEEMVMLGQDLERVVLYRA
ncbi:MAG: formyltetrahydrofolate deformylase, partial [Candidatus Omnitrophica bacterium]|nr:formyltetrahydrofolate deformylase [Candidatus Omnitrophota bacterium]